MKTSTKTRLSGSSISLILIVAVGLAAIIISLNWPLTSKLLPMILGSALVLLGAIKLLDEARKKGKVAKAEQPAVSQEGENEDTWKGYPQAGAWVVGYLLAIIVFGFIFASTFLAFFYTKIHGARWAAAIITTVITTAILYFVFQRFFQIDFYPGILINWITGQRIF